MKFPRREPRAFALSVLIHVVVGALLLSITFYYPLGNLIGLPKDRERQAEKLTYIQVRPSGGGVSGGPSKSPAKGTPAAPLHAPDVVPTAIATPAPAQGGVPEGTGKGTGVGHGGGAATGIEPELPDPRIALSSPPFTPVPKTPAQRLDSAIKTAYGVYVDSANADRARQLGQRTPGDWTKTDKNGNKWGWDQGAIRLGKYSIPNAVLAMLPLNAGMQNPAMDARNTSMIRREVLENAQRHVTEDEFRASVKRIRERKDRERKAAGRDTSGVR
ncbi:MAG: hypothetical protein JWO05_2942 [Gemmatimonadetes bacterium]|nr:hypothetical protein [Gemmatimonadota bacterium]